MMFKLRIKYLANFLRKNRKLTPMTRPVPTAGKIMFTLSWVAALIVLTLFFSDREAQQHNPNRVLKSSTTDGYNQVVLDRNAQYHYLANGSINGKPVTFLVDTGASDVAVPASLADRLGLIPGGHSMMSTANGTVSVRRTQIANLQLGSIQLHDVQASINPGMQGNEVLLGMSFLRHLEFTHKNGQLTLTQQK